MGGDRSFRSTAGRGDTDGAGEFSIVIASLGVSLADGADLGALAAALVLITAVVGPVASRFVDRPAAVAR